MEEFRLMARILAAINASEKEEQFNLSLFDAKVLKTTEHDRDRMLIKLQKEGYVSGMHIEDGVDNARPFVIWGLSDPSITIKGLEFINNDSELCKAIDAMKSISISAAAQTVANAMLRM